MIKIIYGTETNRSLSYATKFSEYLNTLNIDHYCHCMSEYDTDSLFTEQCILIIIVSTFFDGLPPTKAINFYNSLLELKNDFRVERTFLKELKYSVFGLGSKAYKTDFNLVARNISGALKALGARNISQTAYGDEYEEMDAYFEKWMIKTVDLINSRQTEEEVKDIEELIVIEEEGKEMATPSLKKALTKQGYKIIGTHSGVKMCRWTKSMMKGRGGCYKNTFYGIESHRCMEMTPSLACANKCVFCWRHYTNPVGMKWKWVVEEPQFILKNSIYAHKQLIKQMRTSPGVKGEKYEEALEVRHCALSLVGEPIMYPHINKLVDLLHSNKISTFLVTNAQFPEELESLHPVTQLYLSIDSPTKKGLKEIDRPLFPDYWERFISCIKILKNRKERTVFRLTLVKKMNNEEIEEYKKLVEIGEPDFIEIKGVTFCGYGEGTPMKMENVPFFYEVKKFSQHFLSFLKDYGIAAEHEHTCAILLAKNKFYKNGEWNTWIDYDKFHSLVEEGKNFTSIDYSIKTPSWALMGAEEVGFNPTQVKHKRNKSNK